MLTDPGEESISLGRNLTFGLLDHLGRTIVAGGYVGNRFPTEAALSTLHGVSRPVAREALKMLAAKGLLSTRAGEGTTVRPDSAWNLFDPDVLRWLLDRKFSLDLLRDFIQLRVAVEPAAAALVASFADEEGLKPIRAAFSRMQAAEDGGDDMLEADIAFHLAILRASTNPFFAQFCDVVATSLRTSIRFTSRIHGRTADLAAHEAVLRAIEVRDADAARTSMLNIMGDVMKLIVQSSAG
jgi:DNA-binding FadR family transcriptional regulator